MYRTCDLFSIFVIMTPFCEFREKNIGYVPGGQKVGIQLRMSSSKFDYLP